MEILVLGLMKNPAHAREVARALAYAGFEREDIAGDDGFIAGLCHGGVPRDEAHAYAEAVRRGGAVVAVLVGDDAAANQAAVVMSRHGALDIDQCAERWNEYPAGSARIYRNRRLTRRAA